MLKHIMYAAIAVILGVAVMLIPLMMSREISFTNISQTRGGEAEKTLTSSSIERMKDNITSKEISSLQGHEGFSSRFASALPHVTFIVAMGLVAAAAVFVLAKWRL